MLQVIKNIYHGLQALSAQIWYGFPSKKLTLIGVTGTAGKTTTVNLIYKILSAASKKSSMVSTINAQIGEETIDTGFHVTTPDPIDIARLIAKSVAAKCEFMVLEVSSHGLDQNRILGCNFTIGVITSITHEHLDYHKTLENYVKSKVKLLQMAKTVIINVDDLSYNLIKRLLHHNKHIITYGMKGKADITDKTFPFESSLPGRYNQYNCLAAIAVGKYLGIQDSIIKDAIRTFKPLVGRFEEIPNKRGIHIVIDFASKSDALEQLLKTARKIFPKGKIISIFGCAGERDKLKRPMMGKISARLSDITILTAEDPRTEDVNKIIDEIAQGCLKANAKEINKEEIKNPKKGRYFIRIPDRQQAIIFGIALAKKSDCVILSGKGHERSMCYEKTEYPWSEHAAVQAALRET